MSENVEEVLDNVEETQEQTSVENAQVEETSDKPIEQDEEGTIKIDLTKLNQQEDAVQEQSTDDSDVTVGEPEDKSDSEEVVEEVRDAEETVLEEVIEEETAEEPEQKAEAPTQEEIAEAVDDQNSNGVELPENIQKAVDFMNDTGGSLEDYVKLNQDYSKLNEAQLLREYYENTRPHLDKEEIDFLMEDNFAYDEDIDEEREIRKKKIARKEELSKAKKHLEGLKDQYYSEIKSSSRLNPEQQKAVEFFNRYKKETDEANQVAESQKSVFLKQTDNVFNNDFKGFDYQVGDKKYRFKVKDADSVKQNQSDINNFIKRFLNEKNEMSDAKGYHKSLFTAMNADALANHFYEQGKADAMKDSMARSKNVDMDPRGTHEKVTTANGWTIRAVPGDAQSTSRLKIKNKK